MTTKVFISYAHVDDTPIINNFPAIPGEEKAKPTGWLSFVAHILEQNLNKAFGRPEFSDIWIDYKRLKGYHTVDPEIQARIQESDIFVLMMSTGWLESTYCQDELRIFLTTHSEKRRNNRIFLVLQEDLEPDSLPESVNGLTRYQLYSTDKQRNSVRLGDPRPDEETALFDIIATLAKDIKSVAPSISAKSTSTQTDKFEPTKTAYMSLVSDKLAEDRRRIVESLSKIGVEVVPKVNSSKAARSVELQRCDLLLQLLNEDSLTGLPSEDYQEAKDHGLEVVQWCSSAVNIQTLTNTAHSELLRSKEIVISPLVDFEAQLIEKLSPIEEPEKPAEATLIFIHTGQEDIESAKSIAIELKSKGYATLYPLYDGNPEVVDNSIQLGLKHCTKMLVLHKKTPSHVINEYVVEAWARFHHEYPDKSKEIMICTCSCGEHSSGGSHDKITFDAPDITFLNCEDSLSQQCTERFLSESRKVS